MDAEQDVTRIVRSWLRDDGHESADRLLGEVLVLLDSNTQRVAWRPVRPLGGLSAISRLAIAAAAVVVVAAVGLTLRPSVGGQAGAPASMSPAPSPVVTASPSASSRIPIGSVSLTTSNGTLVSVTVPAGGWRRAGPASVCKAGVARTCTGGPNWPTLAVHDVTRVVDDVCLWDTTVPHQQFEDVGPSVDDLATALASQRGALVSGPTDVQIGGYPAKQLTLSLRQDVCTRGPEGRGLWQDVHGSSFGLLKGGTATVWIADVDGERVVVTSTYRGASAEDVAELDAVVASIEIEPQLQYIPPGQNSLKVSGVPFSFTADGSWERKGHISLNRSIAGPQGAEATIYWTGIPDGDHVAPCGVLAALPGDSSAADVATAISTAPGTELVGDGPSDVTVGGRPAKHVVVVVREDLGCDPGYFFSWRDSQGGAFWRSTGVGDTIRIWVVDVDGKHLVIAAETRANVVDWAPMTDVQRTRLDEQIQQVVDSISFE